MTSKSQALLQTPMAPAPTSGLLQRQCDCGNHTIAGGECAECSKKKQLGLQTKLTVNGPGDSYEQEADRVADQVLAKPAHPAVSGIPPRIQRFSWQPTGQMDAAPASVEQALASPGQPLEPSLRQDMEQRFGYDFSRVRVHTGMAAEQSAGDVSAHAYTVGHNMVFGTGQFTPGTHEGRRLIAHELTHMVQQSRTDGMYVSQNNDRRDMSPFVLRNSGSANAALIPGVIALPTVAENHEAASLLLRQPAGTKKLGTSATRTPYELAEQIWQGLLAWSARATPEIFRVRKRIFDYLKHYDAAYKSFSDRLEQAKEEADARDKWVDVLKGIVIGTGVGLVASRLYEAATLVREIAYEAAGEGAEAVIAGVWGGPSGSEFTLPEDLKADKVARGYLEKIDKAWEAHAVMHSATLKFSPRRDELRSAAGGKGYSAKGGAQNTVAPQVADDLNRLKDALDRADKALTTFLATADTPLLDRTFGEIYEDIWIHWAAVLGEKDEDTVEEMLREAGVVGFPYTHSRIEISRGIGFWSNRFYPREVRGRVAEEEHRMTQIGLLGVVIDDRIGHLRHDAYAAIGWDDPDPNRAEEYFHYVYKGPALLKGEIVMITRPVRHVVGLQVVEKLKSPNAGKLLQVTDEERLTVYPSRFATELQREREMMIFGQAQPDISAGFFDQ